MCAALSLLISGTLFHITDTGRWAEKLKKQSRQLAYIPDDIVDKTRTAMKEAGLDDQRSPEDLYRHFGAIWQSIITERSVLTGVANDYAMKELALIAKNAARETGLIAQEVERLKASGTQAVIDLDNLLTGNDE